MSIGEEDQELLLHYEEAEQTFLDTSFSQERPRTGLSSEVLPSDKPPMMEEVVSNSKSRAPACWKPSFSVLYTLHTMQYHEITSMFPNGFKKVSVTQ